MNKFDPNLGLIWSRPRTLAGGLVLAALLTARPASAGLFRSTGAMNTGRDLHTATLLTNGKVLVVGGRSTGTNYLASAELYDLATGTWSFTGPLNKARASHTATLLPNGKVLIAGGFSNSNPDGTGWSPMPDCELYDPDTGTWSLTGALNIPHD